METSLGANDLAWHTNRREDIWPFEFNKRFGYVKDCKDYVHIEFDWNTFVYLPKHDRAVRLHIGEDRNAYADYMADESFQPWMEDFVNPMHDLCETYGYILWSY